MEVHASPAELPERQGFWASFQVRCRRPEGRAALERSTTGRRTELPTKHGETLAQAGPGTSAPRWQECLTNRPWDEADLNRQRGHKRLAAASLGAGVVVLDETGVPKPGTASVGGARQDAGPLGQVGNGQMAVPWCSTASHATWPVAVRWSLPKAWTDPPERRAQARGPTAVTCQPTPELALALLDQARAWEGPPRCRGAEADDGDTPNVLAGLEPRPEPSVVAGRTACQVSLGRTASSPVWRADAVRHRVPRGQWRTGRGRRGTTGGWRQKCVAVRSWRVTRPGPRYPGGGGGERAPPGQPEARQDDWSHRPTATTRAELAGSAHRRHASEPFPAEANGALGWDQDQGRLGPGCHRHAVPVRLAYRLLVGLERRPQGRPKRSGRPGDPCSPPPGAPPQDAPRRAS